jgi:hypothetical protein
VTGLQQLKQGAERRPAAAGAPRVREIVEADLPAVAALLSRGFPFRTPQYWLRGLERQARRTRPQAHPAFGYCLDHGGLPVGVLLLLFSHVLDGDEMIVRCNVSSWYVEPEFRAFGSFLVRAATRDKTVTYFNITPAPHTWSTVEAQGFSVYCRGQIYAAPALSAPVKHASVRSFDDAVAAGLSSYDRDLLRQHAEFGCLSLVVQEGDAAHPFVFQTHRVKHIVPVARLLYCSDIALFERFAGNIGRFLALRGAALVRLDADGPSRRLYGWYSDRRGRKYARGPHPPRLGDLAFTEAALFDSP